ncbi:hypothetical protein TMES_01500 [Thalassospira mesophila]|uniref:Uncharacterized protein n=1 Tax=Thalassospira mesophila TaxID=1293891 RepID=A0A1Y2L6M1_9PROT|nr:hypothetical protein TMES_01500 [Thalassospira mesophila]
MLIIFIFQRLPLYALRSPRQIKAQNSYFFFLFRKAKSMGGPWHTQMILHVERDLIADRAEVLLICNIMRMDGVSILRKAKPLSDQTRSLRL